MSGKGKAKGELADRRGGGYFLFPDCLLASEAWQAASPLSIKLLIALCARHNGRNNGRITLSAREAAVAIGTKNFRAISRAFAELELLGLAALAKSHPRCERMAREYRLTFVSVGEAPATNDYLLWKPGDAGTRKKRAAPTAAETCLSAEATAAGAKVSAEPVATDSSKSTDFGNVSAEDGSTHIINHRGGSFSDLQNDGKIAGGPFAKPNGRAVVLSAAPPVEEMRARVKAYVERFGRGAQTRLAEQAHIPAGTFSKFLNHGGPLNDQARLRLTCAFPRSEAEERRVERVA